MQRILLLTVAAALGICGCSSGPTGTAEGEGGKKLTLTLPPIVKVTQADEEKFSVTIVRENFEGPVTVTFDNLPDGLTIKEGDLAFDKAKGTESKTVTVVATEKAKPQKEITLTASAVSSALPGTKAKANTLLTVMESLETKTAKKEEFANGLQKRLDAVEQQLKEDTKRLADASDPAAKAAILEDIADATEDLEMARDNFKKQLLAAPPESWEDKKDDVADDVGDLESAVRRITTRVEAALSKGKE